MLSLAGVLSLAGALAGDSGAPRAVTPAALDTGSTREDPLGHGRGLDVSGGMKGGEEGDLGAGGGSCPYTPHLLCI